MKNRLNLFLGNNAREKILIGNVAFDQGNTFIQFLVEKESVVFGVSDEPKNVSALLQEQLG